MIRKKIVIVDDNNAILQMGKELLREHYDVFPLPTVAKMFEALSKVVPDLILLDIKMPDVDGFDAIERLKADDRYAKIPVIFLTGSYAVENAVKGFGLGAVDYITKPFSNPAFIECVKKHLAKSEKAEKNAVDAEYVIEQKPIILVVDDSPTILRSVNSILSDTYKVYTLPKPEKLQDFLQNVKPRLFLLDYKMPELTGFDLIPVIRGFAEHASTPIIFLTSDGTLSRLTEAVKLGASDFIVKPFTNELLHEKVAKYI